MVDQSNTARQIKSTLIAAINVLPSENNHPVADTLIMPKNRHDWLVIQGRRLARRQRKALELSAKHTLGVKALPKEWKKGIN